MYKFEVIYVFAENIIFQKIMKKILS